MTWTDAERERRISDALARVEVRLVELAGDRATGSIAVHFSAGVPRRLEVRIVEHVDDWGRSR